MTSSNFPISPKMDRAITDMSKNGHIAYGGKTRDHSKITKHNFLNFPLHNAFYTLPLKHMLNFKAWPSLPYFCYIMFEWPQSHCWLTTAHERMLIFPLCRDFPAWKLLLALLQANTCFFKFYKLQDSLNE
jgi:hypothetical protein